MVCARFNKSTSAVYGSTESRFSGNWAEASCALFVRLSLLFRASIERQSFHDLGESLAAHALAFQDPVKSVMANACVTFYPSNSNLENVIFDIFTRNYLFRLLIFERLEFNKTQILTLLPSPVGFFPHVSTGRSHHGRSFQQPSRVTL